MTNFNIKDYYFNKAKAQGFKARSVYKLSEIDEALHLIKKDSKILDLGSAPGSWLQYIATKIGKDGLALGVDLSAIPERFHQNITTAQEDCFQLTKEKIASLVGCSEFDLVLSDMAPKTTGIKHVDQIRSLDLAEQAVALSHEVLKPNGHLVIKVFASAEVSALIGLMKKSFQTVKQMRPKSVRSVSKEFYIVGLNKKHQKCTTL